MLRQSPPGIPSRCGKKPPACKGILCPNCPVTGPAVQGGKPSVRFQLTYTCNSAIYSPCYCPAIPCCPIIPKKKKKEDAKKMCCCIKWLDCCGRPVN